VILCRVAGTPAAFVLVDSRVRAAADLLQAGFGFVRAETWHSRYPILVNVAHVTHAWEQEPDEQGPGV
jgi:hypothetical protein